MNNTLQNSDSTGAVAKSETELGGLLYFFIYTMGSVVGYGIPALLGAMAINFLISLGAWSHPIVVGLLISPLVVAWVGAGALHTLLMKQIGWTATNRAKELTWAITKRVMPEVVTSSIAAGLIILLFFGVLPAALYLWVMICGTLFCVFYLTE
jgi:hypothetical protein